MVLETHEEWEKGFFEREDAYFKKLQQQTLAENAVTTNPVPHNQRKLWPVEKPWPPQYLQPNR